MSTLLKMQKIHPLCSRCIGMYPLQNRWTVLRYLQCYENFSECCTHLILPETALFSPTPTFAKEPLFYAQKPAKQRRFQKVIVLWNRVQKQKNRLGFPSEPVFCLRKRFFVGKNAPKIF